MIATKSDPRPALSLIIPILNEGSKIADDIRSAAEFCHGYGITTEIIIADDGSTDDGINIARETESHLPEDINLVILENREHRGKGAAVRSGVLEAQGEIIMFADSGGNVAWEFLMAGLDLIRNGACQIAHGSRKLPKSNILKRQSLLRRLLSIGFQRLSHAILPLPEDLTDTQCGFKLYTKDAAETLYRNCVLEGFLFDLEIILSARNAGFVIVEFPIDWAWDKDSRLRYGRSTYLVLKELVFLFKTFGRSRG